MSEIQVIKRDGNKDTLDLEKLHKVVFYACDGINGVSASEVEIKSRYLLSIHAHNFCVLFSLHVMNISSFGIFSFA